MRLLRLSSSSSSEVPPCAVIAHDARDPSEPSRILARKGTFLSHAEVADLLARPVQELHLLVPDEGDLTEDEAATSLAEIVAGAGVACSETHYGQVNFTSSQRGLFRIDERAVDDINSQPGVLLFTADPDYPVEPGASLGGVKCAPLLLAQDTVEMVRTIGSALEVVPFRPTKVAFVAPRTRLRGNAFDQAHAALSASLRWYGSTLDIVPDTQPTIHGIARAFREADAAGAGLILAAGAAATDPADLLFDGLRAADGEVLQIGVPAEPGTACWIGRLDDTPVLGLASCELFGKPGAVDVLLPRILAGQPLTRSLVRGLGRGGLVVGGPSRLAPYHTSQS